MAALALCAMGVLGEIKRVLATASVEGSQRPHTSKSGCRRTFSSMRRPMIPKPMMANLCFITLSDESELNEGS